MRKILIVGLFLSLSISQEPDARLIRFVQYFASEADFIANLKMLATERFKQPYLQVFYNQKKQPIIKEWVDADGTTIRKERLEYSDENQLVRRYRFSVDGTMAEMIQYGEDEPWGLEFRKVLLKPNQQIIFEGSKSIFRVDPEFNIQTIRFLTVDGTPYGEIDFIYDHLGFLIGENWLELPNSLTVRRFAYNYDLISGRREIWEFDATGQEKSHVTLVQVPADKLYKRPPPPRGNRLDELAVILEDIQSNPLRIPFDVFIPESEYDLLILTNGDQLEIDVINLETNRLLFRLAGDTDTLTIPLGRVESLVSKYGEKLYP